jgi:hypothetical protein
MVVLVFNIYFTADFENQGAHRLAKQYDPEGKRTIGNDFAFTFFYST